MADTLQQLLRERADQDNVAVKYGDRTWTWREHVAEASAQAAAIIDIADTCRPLHVGVLMGNTPDMLTAMAAAGLGGYVLCWHQHHAPGRRPRPRHRAVDCQILLTDPAHRHLLDGLDLPGVRVIDVSTDEWAATDRRSPALTPHREVGPDDTFMMIFTSGTSGDPRPSRCRTRCVLFAGSALVERYAVEHFRRLLPVDAAVPLQCRVRGLGRRARCRRGDGARGVLGVPLPRRRAPVRRHVHELRRKAAGLHPRDAGAVRRSRQSAARRLRQRGRRPRHRRVRASVRLRRLGRVRIDRERGHHHPGRRLPAGVDRQGLSRRGDL